MGKRERRTLRLRKGGGEGENDFYAVDVFDQGLLFRPRRAVGHALTSLLTKPNPASLTSQAAVDSLKET